ncbi:MAG TPA: ribulose-phosphate 3-epimerase [Thermoproteota archaeon]|nr:ribulose-phosphate 3-epimerase [Thermoproteota archaeon]
MSPRSIEIAASILSADFTRLGEEVKKAESGGADIIHVDIMDGRFVPSMTVGPMVVKAVKRITSLPVDVHLMVEDPAWFVRELEGSGVDMMSIHPEATRRLDKTLERIRRARAKAGVALNPSTPLNALDCPLDAMDYLLIMTVSPGFGGQAFMPSVLPKMEEARRKFRSSGLDPDIEVDGGVNPQTAPQAVSAGANILVAGSAIYDSPDAAAAISELRRSVAHVTI